MESIIDRIGGFEYRPVLVDLFGETGSGYLLRFDPSRPVSKNDIKTIESNHTGLVIVENVPQDRRGALVSYLTRFFEAVAVKVVGGTDYVVVGVGLQNTAFIEGEIISGNDVEVL